MRFCVSLLWVVSFSCCLSLSLFILSIPFVLFLSVDFSLVISVFSVSLDRCAPLSLSTTAYRESPFYTHQNIIQLSFDFIQTVTLARSFAYFFLSFVTFYSFVPLAIFSKRFRYFTTSSFVFDNVGLNQCILSFWMRKQGSPAPIIASPL